MSKYNIDAAARVAYEGIIREHGCKVGKNEIPTGRGTTRIVILASWDELTSFRQENWREFAREVIGAATGENLRLTPVVDVRNSTPEKSPKMGKENEQGVRVRRRPSAKRRHKV